MQRPSDSLAPIHDSPTPCQTAKSAPTRFSSSTKLPAPQFFFKKKPSRRKKKHSTMTRWRVTFGWIWRIQSHHRKQSDLISYPAEREKKNPNKQGRRKPKVNPLLPSLPPPPIYSPQPTPSTKFPSPSPSGHHLTSPPRRAAVVSAYLS